MRPAAREKVSAEARQVRLRVDPTACDGIGMCAHLAPGVIDTDSWGYPILPADPLDSSDLKAVNAAIAGCPRRALFLQP